MLSPIVIVVVLKSRWSLISVLKKSLFLPQDFDLNGFHCTSVNCQNTSIHVLCGIFWLWNICCLPLWYFYSNVFYFVHRQQFNGHYSDVVNHYRNYFSWWRGRRGGDCIVVISAYLSPLTLWVWIPLMRGVLN